MALSRGHVYLIYLDYCVRLFKNDDSDATRYQWEESHANIHRPTIGT
jgi:hypothetical protein